MSKIAAGHLLIIETGEYSDRSWHGPFRVLKDFDQAEVSETFRQEWSPDECSWRDREDGPSEHDIMPWLARNGYIDDVDNVRVWHVGSYGFSPEIDREVAE